MSDTTTTTTELDQITESCKRDRFHLCGVYLRTGTVNLRMVGKLTKTARGYRLDASLDPMDLGTNEIDFSSVDVASIIGSNVYLINF